MGDHVYPEDERPPVEVDIDGTWRTGALVGWWWASDGQLLMNVEWRTDQGGTFLDTVTAERVRGEGLKLPTSPASTDNDSSDD